MPAAFVPFFEKSAPADVPQYQFSQFKLSKITLAAPQSVRRIERIELKSKLLSDLRNALHLSLPADAVQKIVADLTKYRTAERPSDLEISHEGDGGTPPGAPPDKPNIKLQKEGEKVTNIIVECDCGQVIAMDCIY